MTKIRILDNTNQGPFTGDVINKLLSDLRERSGFEGALTDLDEESHFEITETWKTIIDGELQKHLLSPEDTAMLQALYSRSPKSVDEHLQKVRTAGSGKFMDQFYVGYGHASIGDCGSTTIFIEGVSMLAAKAIQDNPLYSGQEASTRYMDFSAVEIENPYGTSEGADIQKTWMDFYNNAFPRMIDHLQNRYPRLVDEDEKVYERAIKARAFDVLRAFIPAGATTNLSWHTNLRQARDKLRWLVAHPNAYLADLAIDIAKSLHERYPHSGFGFYKRTDADFTEIDYRLSVMDEFAYIDDRGLQYGPSIDVQLHLDVKHLLNTRVRKLLQSRPPKQPVPPMFSGFGTITSKFMLDFGSFRDLQRHRNGYVRMPLLTTRYGFHPWYGEQMPVDLREEAQTLVGHQAVRIRALRGADKIMRQAYIAMGFQVVCEVVQSLPAWVYRVELRSQKSVHPTLRQVAQEEARQFRQMTSEQIPLYVDDEPDTWDLRRGKQTILDDPR